MINSLPPGNAASTIAAVSLFIHVLITYLIKGTVLGRLAYNDRAKQPQRHRTRGHAHMCSHLVPDALLRRRVRGSILRRACSPVRQANFSFVLPVLFCRAEGAGRAASSANLSAARGDTWIGVAMFTVGATGEVITIIERWRNRVFCILRLVLLK